MMEHGLLLIMYALLGLAVIFWLSMTGPEYQVHTVYVILAGLAWPLICAVGAVGFTVSWYLSSVGGKR